MFTFTILFQDAEVACATADDFADARELAIDEARDGFYGSVLRDCEFSSVAPSGVRIAGPLFI
nr:hypothetical protein HUO10_003290 [Paraburkholderia busanensis]